MIHLNKNILFYLLIFSFAAFAQKIDKIEINSNTIFSDGEIKQWASLNEGQNFYPGILDTSLSRISTNLISNGYFNFSFEGSQFELSSDSQKVNLLLNVDEGQPTFVKELFFKASDSVNVDDFISSLNYLKGEIFNRYEIETSISSLLTDFENRGFPFAAVKIQSVHLYDDSVSKDHYADIYLALEEGRQSRIDKIEVTGNTSTKDYVITRELRMQLMRH